MYNEYFGFSEAPFSIAPDPRYLYLSERHTEALAHLIYGIKCQAGGFVLLTGDVGTGKTTICRCLLEQLPEDCDVALIFNPKLTIIELLSTICDELGIAYSHKNSSVKVFVNLLNAHLLASNARGRKTVLIIDEAQNLSAEVLEQLRLLTNLETNERKLLQVLLLGQPELRERLDQPELRQLAQRVIARYHLERLSRKEVSRYVAHRLFVANGRRPLFPADVIDLIYRLTLGTPRLINLLCDRALLGTYVQGRETVDRATLHKSALEVFGPRRSRFPGSGWRRFGLAAFALGLFGAGLTVAYQTSHEFASLTRGVFGLAASPAPAPQAETAAPSASASSRGEVAQQNTEKSAPAPESATVALTSEQQTVAPNSQDRAVRALARLWGTDISTADNGSVCEALEKKGLRCLSGIATLSQLRQMNVPAVLRLRSDPGAPNLHGVLLALQGDQAALRISGETLTLPTPTLANEMTGHYLLLWRGPIAGPARPLKAGSRGEEVVWLHKRIAALTGKAEPVLDETLFDAALEQRIQEFQTQQGLVPDGVASPVTLVRLAVAADPQAPTLAGRRSN